MLNGSNAQATQPEHLARVARRLDGLILAFARDRLATRRPEFHMHELTAWVSRHTPTAPDSAGRILRNLKARGRLLYVVRNRRASLYCLTYAEAV